MRKKKSRFTDTALVNDQTYFDFLYRLRKIATSMFEWQNLPESMDARFLELSLYYRGVAGLLYDEEYGFINTQATSAGELNIYGLPVTINCYSYGYSKIRNVYNGLVEPNIKEKEAILVLNNAERLPTAPTLELFAMRLYEAERSSDVNIKAQKTPILIVTDDNQRLSMETMYKQIDGNLPAIFGDRKLLNIDSVKAIRTDAPYVADKLQEYKTKIWNEALAFLGVNNLDEKRERLISDETSQNNEMVNYNLQSYLVPRQKACEQFNEKYGLSGDKAIKVKIRSDLANVIKEAESIISDYNVTSEVEDE